MTDTDRDEQRRHWATETLFLKAIFGVLTAAVIGGVTWVLTTEGRLASQSSAIETLAERADRSDARHEDAAQRLSRAEAARADTREAIARVEERLESQGDSLRRVENAIVDLTDYLRQRDGG